MWLLSLKVSTSPEPAVLSLREWAATVLLLASLFLILLLLPHSIAFLFKISKHFHQRGKGFSLEMKVWSMVEGPLGAASAPLSLFIVTGLGDAKVFGSVV